MIDERRHIRPSVSWLTRSLRWPTAIGAVIGVLGTGFVVAAFVQNRTQAAAALANADMGLLVLALGLASLGMVGIGTAWQVSLRILGRRLDVISALRAYFVGQLGKYVPGGIWAIMGRGEWARSAGVPAPIAYSSVLLSMGSAYLAAMMLVVLLIPLSGPLDLSREGGYVFVLLLLPIGFLFIHPRVLRASLRIVRHLTGWDLRMEVPSWGATTALVLLQMPSWLFIGSTSVVIAAAFGADGNIVNLISATALAWIVGFISLPVPGGIGVREAVFVALATSLPTGVAATVAVTARLVFVTVDAAGAALTSLLSTSRERGAR